MSGPTLTVTMTDERPLVLGADGRVAPTADHRRNAQHDGAGEPPLLVRTVPLEARTTTPFTALSPGGPRLPVLPSEGQR